VTLVVFVIARNPYNIFSLIVHLKNCLAHHLHDFQFGYTKEYLQLVWKLDQGHSKEGCGST
jgi:hypothetical protein